MGVWGLGNGAWVLRIRANLGTEDVRPGCLEALIWKLSMGLWAPTGRRADEQEKGVGLGKGRSPSGGRSSQIWDMGYGVRGVGYGVWGMGP